ncbi:hypothetical protein MRX96_015209 [Rhipicephalus microplus]
MLIFWLPSQRTRQRRCDHIFRYYVTDVTWADGRGSHSITSVGALQGRAAKSRGASNEPPAGQRVHKRPERSRAARSAIMGRRSPRTKRGRSRHRRTKNGSALAT